MRPWRRTSGAFTFNRTDIDLRQYLGFLAGRRVMALRGVLSTTHAADGAEVPFYLMPSLGGKDSLRGFRDYWFRAPHSLLLQGEYRWEIPTTSCPMSTGANCAARASSLRGSITTTRAE